MSKHECLLSRPDIGIVSENDHRVGLCLCALCTCGKHICVSSRRHRKGRFATNYQSTFRRQTQVPVKRPEPQQYSPDLRKMDFQTSHQREFQSFTVHRRSESDVRTLTPPLKFNSHSSYVADFPNWGEVAARVEKRPQLPTRLHQVHFRGQSMYSSTFLKPRVRQENPPVPSRRSSVLPLGTWSDDKSTTSQSSYRPYGREYMSKVAKRPREGYTKVEASPLHFRSVSQTTYQARPSSFKDPHLVRKKALSSRTYLAT